MTARLFLLPASENRVMTDDEPSPVQDRRVQTGLRALIDEMMHQVRAAAAHDGWSPEERARAETDLARIMSRVRERALDADATGPRLGGDA